MDNERSTERIVKAIVDPDRDPSPNRDLLVLDKPYYKPLLLRKQAQYYPTHGIARLSTNANGIAPSHNPPPGERTFP